MNKFTLKTPALILACLTVAPQIAYACGSFAQHQWLYLALALVTIALIFSVIKIKIFLKADFFNEKDLKLVRNISIAELVTAVVYFLYQVASMSPCLVSQETLYFENLSFVVALIVLFISFINIIFISIVVWRSSVSRKKVIFGWVLLAVTEIAAIVTLLKMTLFLPTFLPIVIGVV